jgi:hypothetical protein
LTGTILAQVNGMSARRPFNVPNRGSTSCCPVCHGQLVADIYVDTIDAGGHVWIRALRCVQCRTIADAAGEPFSHRSGIQRVTTNGLTPPHIGDEVTPLGT